MIVIHASITACLSNKQSINGLPCIDISKNYPEKEILLTVISDVSYLRVSTEENDYFYIGTISGIKENTIVIPDRSSGAILFFSRDGKPKSRFNRYGRGPEEYPQTYSTTIYDETADEVFIQYQNIIQVYSSTGVHKRKIILPTMYAGMIDFDDQSLFLHDSKQQFHYLDLGIEETDFTPHLCDSSYFRISKMDGKVLEYVVRPSNETDLVAYDNDGGRSLQSLRYMKKCSAGLLLCDPATDTVFLYGEEKTIIPLFCKTPLVNKLSPKVVLTDFMDIGTHQYFRLATLVNHHEDSKSFPDKYYVRDKETGKIFHQKITLPDFKGKELFISAQNTLYTGKETIAIFELDLLELKEAYIQNKLSGKLKELVATLRDDDNNVYVIAQIK